MNECLDEIIGLIRPGGAISRIIPRYCYRREQEKMMRAIVRILDEGGCLLAEAGTGVGKSLAYLIPAAYHAHLTGERVVVATRTRALQRQLMEHDLPMVEAALPFPLRYAEAKGRENYLCQTKYRQALAGRVEMTDKEREFLEAVWKWAEKTETGDRMELDLEGDLLASWPLIGSDRFSCQGARCAYPESCFVTRARRTWEKAHILVANHALLLTDAAMGHAVLPEYKVLIVDEAHQFSREARERFSLTFGLPEIRDVLSRLAYRTGSVERGLLAQIATEHPEVGEYTRSAREWRYAVEERAVAFFEGLNEALELTNGGYRQRLTRADFDNVMSAAGDEWDRLGEAMGGLAGSLKSLGNELDDDFKERVDGASAEIAEIIASTSVVDTDWGSPDRVVWAEPDSTGQITTLNSSPVWVDEGLNEMVYPSLDTLIMVSATLTVAGSFNYTIRNCGLNSFADKGTVGILALSSPFNYEENCRVLVPTDVPAPNAPEFDEFLIQALHALIMTARRRTLVLFTSVQQMARVSARLRPVLNAADIPLLVQNEDGQFAAIMDRAAESPASVIMGTDTFWEGVDLPGDMLSLLIVVRLPFRPPADPFYQAWEEALWETGESAFAEMMLPEAVIKFKQGMGRLIRGEEDRGIIIVLDRRFLAPPRGKRYAKSFRTSLPMKNIEELPFARILTSL